MLFFAEFENHFGNPTVVLQFILEDGIPISEFTLFIVKHKGFAIRKKKAFNLINDVYKIPTANMVLNGEKF